MLKLRNGTEAPRNLIMTSWLAIKQIADNDDLTSQMTLYEARELARDPSHPLWPGTDQVLRAFSLISENGKMYEVTRAVILSCVIGDELDLRVDWPVDAPEPSEGSPS